MAKAGPTTVPVARQGGEAGAPVVPPPPVVPVDRSLYVASGQRDEDLPAGMIQLYTSKDGCNWTPSIELPIAAGEVFGDLLPSGQRVFYVNTLVDEDVLTRRREGDGAVQRRLVV